MAKPVKTSSASVCRMGRFYGIGAGPGDPELLTLKAARILRSVAVIYYASGVNSSESISGQIMDRVGGCQGRRVELTFSMAPDMKKRRGAWKSHAKRIVADLKQGRDCAFVTLGDPLIYSTYIYLLREVQALMPKVEVETVPGIASFQAAAAKTHRALVEDREVLALIPAWTEETAHHPVLANVDTAVLLKTYRHRDKALAALTANGLTGSIVYAVRVGLDGESISSRPEDWADKPEDYLSLIIAKRNALESKP